MINLNPERSGVRDFLAGQERGEGIVRMILLASSPKGAPRAKYKSTQPAYPTSVIQRRAKPDVGIRSPWDCL